MKLRRRLRSVGYSEVMATIGVFIALGGTSYAAVKIDGSDVRNGTLTGKDVRNRSLGRIDLKRSALSPAAAGKAGEPGPRGATGPAGVRGLPGPVQVVTSRGPFSQTLNTEPVEMASVDLDAGSWLLTASGTLKNSVGRRNVGECEIASSGGRPVGTGPVALDSDISGPDLDTEVFSLSSTASQAGPIRATLSCEGFFTGVRVEQSSLTAVRVTDIDDQTTTGD